MKGLTQARLKELLHYDPKTGIFVNLVQRKKALEGAVAGCDSGRYITIQIDGKGYSAHRLAWLYVYGYFPERLLDHINRDRADNRISNLREVSEQCNVRNTGNYKNNTSGVKGVYLEKARGKWRANIKVDGKTKSLGSYENFDNAVCARLAGEQCLNWSGCDSSSPAFKYALKHKLVKQKDTLK